MIMRLDMNFVNINLLLEIVLIVLHPRFLGKPPLLKAEFEKMELRIS